jgi:Flp pilus assembly protein TadD
MALIDQRLQTLLDNAMERAQAGDFAAAEPMLAEVVRAMPNSGLVSHLLGQVRLKLGRFAEARHPLERAAKFLPRVVDAQINYAGCLTMLGDYEASLWAFDRALKLKPDDPSITHNRGHALERLGRLEEAERAYDQALRVDHRLTRSLIARAGLLEARGDWGGALADLDMALTDHPNDKTLLVRRGELLLQQGDWMRGLADYEARLDLPGLYVPELPRWQGEPVESLLIYPEQADIESDAARRDTLMLARGVEAVVQCGETLADWLEGPTLRRGASLAGFTAAAPLRSLPYLLNWSPDSPPPAPPLRHRSESRSPVVGEDTWQTHLAARQGIATTIHLPAKADWLWGRQAGPSPWYPSVELVRKTACD